MSVEPLDSDTQRLSEDDARAIVNRIRQCVEIAIVEIRRAWAGRAWIALGYSSWDDLCAAEFGQVQLPRDERPAAVAELRAAGMSTRAIASATGVHHSTVAADLSRVGNPTPADDGIVDAEIVEPPSNVIGLDGKVYTPPPPRPALSWMSDDPADIHAGHIRRSRKRLEEFVNGWGQFRDLRSHPDRDEILADLTDNDRRIVLEAEEVVWNR